MLFKLMKTAEQISGKNMKMTKILDINFMKIQEYKMWRKFGVSFQMLYLNILWLIGSLVMQVRNS